MSSLHLRECKLFSRECSGWIWHVGIWLTMRCARKPAAGAGELTLRSVSCCKPAGAESEIAAFGRNGWSTDSSPAESPGSIPPARPACQRQTSLWRVGQEGSAWCWRLVTLPVGVLAGSQSVAETATGNERKNLCERAAPPQHGGDVSQRQDAHDRPEDGLPGAAPPAGWGGQ